MFETLDPPSGGIAKENERNLHWQKWSITTPHSNSTTFYGICFGYVECYQWDFIRPNQVGFSHPFKN